MTLLQSGITKSLAEDYTIDQSLRFDDGDSAFLKRTPGSAGNQKTFTISLWVKRGELGTNQDIFAPQLGGDGSNESKFEFTTADVLNFYDSGGTRGSYTTTQKFRDVGAWYHIVVAVDTTDSTSGDRIKIYVNGDQITAFSASAAPGDSVDLGWNGTSTQYIGVDATGGSENAGFFDGYIAEFYNIDGQQLTPSSFAETDDTTNQWKPIDAVDDLTFGTNGFYQKYAATELANSFTDSSSPIFTPTESLSVNVLVIGGGGAGGGSPGSSETRGGGGGAGGFRTSTGVSVTAQDYTVTIGAGGVGNETDSAGESGGSSTFSTITSSGGGGGGSKSGAAYSGGSGGGGGTGSGVSSDGGSGDAGGYTPVEGYAGGNGQDHTGGDRAAGGGGGSSEVGVNASSTSTAGTGGNGTASSITGASVTYAGGGGGGGNAAEAAGGSGGGGSGGQWNMVGANATGYGSGGGGAGNNGQTNAHKGGNGSSGLVIISYISTTAKATGGTITSYVDGSDTYQVHTFTHVVHTITANGDVTQTRASNSPIVTSFTSTGTTSWTAPIGVTSVEYLVVAGGGGGGNCVNATEAAGGGAGGVRTGTLSVTAGSSYTVTVGAGGASSSDGSNSVFSTITSTGGGAGGDSANPPSGTGGSDGGSGGGGGYNSGSAGSGNAGGFDPVEGYDGQAFGGSGKAGGGGGAGEAGGTDGNGQGGDGIISSITGSDVYYGGGGGGRWGSTNASGGSGGGGSASAGAGTANTGGGGGGRGGTLGSGGSGGSGIVVLKYTQSDVAPGTSSIAFDGTGDYLTVPSSSDFGFGTGDFTLEGWVRISSTGTQWIYGGSVSNNLDILYNYSSTKFDVYLDEVEYNFNSWTALVDTWYHIALCRSGTDLRVFVDGTQIDSTKTSSDSVPTTGIFIGAQYNAASAWNGYMDELRISDSARYTSAFTPSTTQFTADSNTMLLIHSDWDGGLGADSSGNKNDFTVTNLVATDQMKDSPTNNFATWNPLNIPTSNDPTFSEGNLQSVVPTGWGGSSTIEQTSGKWYAEFLFNASTGASEEQCVGVIYDANITADANEYPGRYSRGYSYYRDGDKINDGNYTSYGDSYTTGDIIGVALNLDDDELKFYKNNVVQNSGTAISITTGQSFGFAIGQTAGSRTATWIANFGADSSFAGNETAQGNQDGNSIGDFYYEPPTDFLALCTSNLSDPEIKLPGDYFNAILRDGTYPSGGSFTGVGFQADLSWQKPRNLADSNQLVDSVRGVSEILKSDTTGDERTDVNFITSFDSDGFTMGSNDWETSVTVVAWNWLGANGTVTNTDGTNIDSTVSANTTAGFSICTYTGTGTNADSFGHGLTEKPQLVIIKARDLTNNWLVGATDVYGTSSGEEGYQIINLVNAVNHSNGGFYSAPTASVVVLGNWDNVNQDTNTYVAYCFHSVEGYSKVGAYEGNNSADGTFVYTGFSPSFVMVKGVDTSDNWTMWDNKRPGYNVTNKELNADDSAAESANAPDIDFTSNGFKRRDTAMNASSTYLYIAFAQSPFKYANAR